MAKKIKCTCCGIEKTNTREFYASSSYLYRDIGRIPICKSCVEEKYNVIANKFKDKKISAMKIFQSIDVYFDEELFDSTISKYPDDNKWIGEYMRIINSNAKYKGKTSEDNIEVEMSIVKNIDNEEDVENEIDDDLIDKWGEREEKDYKRLERKYKKYIKKYPSKDLEQQVIIRSICELELEKEVCRKDKNYTALNALDKRISERMAELDIIPSKKKSYEEDEKVTFGNIMKIYEQEEPIMDTQGIYKDVDFINSYWNRTFIKPFAMAWGWAKGFYTVDDGDKNIEFNDDMKEIIEGKSNDN